MKTTVTIIGALLIIAGVALFGYQGITYTKEEKVAQIGDLALTAEKEKTIWVSPFLAGGAIAVGVILVFMGQRK